MSAVLGISGLYHDAAAALMVDGVLVAAIQEERLSRQKNDARLPLRAANACLEMAGIDAGALDQVVFYENPYAKLERVMLEAFRRFPRGLRQFPRAMANQLGGKLFVLDHLARHLGVSRSRIEHVSHHASHAASAFFMSPFERAAVLTLDAVGEHETATLSVGEGATLRTLSTVHYPDSLGLFYAAFTALLGFRVNEGEFKMMGLSAHGTPRFKGEIERFVRVAEDGGFELELDAFAHHTHPTRPFARPILDAVGPARESSAARPWDLRDPRDQRYADIAASVQAVLERAVLAMAERARRETDADALCLAGGVALNSLATRRIARDAGFSRVFVQPAAGDAGGALGAAILGAIALGDARPAPMGCCALGVCIERDVAHTEATAAALGLRVSRVQDPYEVVAARLLRGQTVATCFGRFEWGPRALGQRSILAPPDRVQTRDALNALKRRESFRPFAPAVLKEHAATDFDIEPSASLMTPFMTTVADVRADASLGAVTHADDTARVQTVDATSSPPLHGILTQMANQGARPVVLNTSLNGAGSPICASGVDALGFFRAHQHGVSALVVHDLLIQRPDQVAAPGAER